MTTKIWCLLACCVIVSVQAMPWDAEPRDKGWLRKHDALRNMTHAHHAEVKFVFLGDSITEGWAHNGHQVWTQHYEPRHAFNYGVGGDRTEHILWRIANGEFEKVAPKAIALMIGTNNISFGQKVADIVKGVNAILDSLKKTMPNAKVLLLSVLPRHTTKLDTEVHEINKLIKRFADDKHVYYLDLAEHFETSLAHEKAELYVGDKLHLSSKGYEMWYKVMEPMFAHLIA